MVEASKSIEYKDEFLKALLDGNFKILNKVYSEFAPSIRRYIESNGGSTEEAKDIFQDAIETILFKLQRGEVQLTSSFKNYLFGICKFLWLNRARKIAKRPLVSEKEIEHFCKTEAQTILPQGQIVSAETAVSIQRWELLQEKIGELPTDCQAIYKLSLTGTKGKGIGEVLGKTVSHIRKIKSTCKQKLMALVQKDGRYQVFY